MWWYSLGIYIYTGGIKIVSPFVRKAKLWARGRKDIFTRLRREVAGKEILWIHAASLGEFEQGRPIIEAVRERYPQYRILLTFFSPSGYEIRKNYSGADWVFYLPADTPRNAERFLDTVRPRAAVFVKYEFWLNYLAGLARRGIPTYIISAVFRRDSVFFKPYGSSFRRALASFSRIFVQDENSRALLAEIGVNRVSVAGDTRFDRVAEIAEKAGRLPVIEDFVGTETAFIAGSTWEPDEKILTEIINSNPGMKFIVAPHEMDERRIRSMMEAVEGGAVRYTHYGQTTAANRKQLLVVDTVGILSSVYRYGRFAYIGGGFGAGIHNTLEAAAYSIPVAFGPNYGKFREAKELIQSGGGRSISSSAELSAWLEGVRENEETYAHAARAAGDYVRSQCGATEMILKEIFETGK